MEFKVDFVTVKSCCHEKNEDCFICSDKYVVIADGMGGEACGDIASKIAISTVSLALDSSLNESCSEKDIRELTFSAISCADKEITK